ncbi:hypothetical protein VTN77DRAFT_834 [Rasamsonia byssochlamydoides]|uniref:uncharacterized protein n=1 Tax=Rasamsonia byssochlamydoides TaxID=89139 RepID=UPI003742C5D1
MYSVWSTPYCMHDSVVAVTNGRYRRFQPRPASRRGHKLAYVMDHHVTKQNTYCSRRSVIPPNFAFSISIINKSHFFSFSLPSYNFYQPFFFLAVDSFLYSILSFYYQQYKTTFQKSF